MLAAAVLARIKVMPERLLAAAMEVVAMVEIIPTRQLPEEQIRAAVAAETAIAAPDMLEVFVLALPEGQELQSCVTLDHSEELAAQSQHLVDTPITHLLLQGHLQHEPLCKSL